MFTDVYTWYFIEALLRASKRVTRLKCTQAVSMRGTSKAIVYSYKYVHMNMFTKAMSIVYAILHGNHMI